MMRHHLIMYDLLTFYISIKFFSIKYILKKKKYLSDCETFSDIVFIYWLVVVFKKSIIIMYFLTGILYIKYDTNKKSDHLCYQIGRN